jgi:hypothetical protein
MKIGLSKSAVAEYRALASQMIANGATIADTNDELKCVLDGSAEEQERAATPGRLFYSFEHEGKVFHLSFD